MVKDLLNINPQQLARGQHLTQTSIDQLYKEARLITGTVAQ